MNVELPRVRGLYKLKYELGRRSWFGVGGQAMALFEPRDEDDLSYFLRNFKDKKKIKVIGNTSNLIVPDTIGEFVVIKIPFKEIKLVGDYFVFAGSGISDKALSQFMCKKGIGGFEFLSTIPGTIGGAICTNAGCFGSEIADILVEAYAIDENGCRVVICNKDLGFKYRGLSIKKNTKKLFFTGAMFKGFASDKLSILNKINDFKNLRLKSQPLGLKTFGSIFRNPKNASSWRLIDKAGCRGMSIGGAAISQQHCNFMININNATFDDAINLKNKVSQKVKENTGVKLEEEVIIL